MAVFVLVFIPGSLMIGLKNSNKMESSFKLALIVTLGSRIAWIITISIIFHRVNEMWSVS